MEAKVFKGEVLEVCAAANIVDREGMADMSEARLFSRDQEVHENEDHDQPMYLGVEPATLDTARRIII
jgi:hypothetical protein